MTSLAELSELAEFYPSSVGVLAKELLAAYEAVETIRASHAGWHVCQSGHGLGAKDFEADSPSALEPCPTWLRADAILRQGETE